MIKIPVAGRDEKKMIELLLDVFSQMHKWLHKSLRNIGVAINIHCPSKIIIGLAAAHPGPPHPACLNTADLKSFKAKIYHCLHIIFTLWSLQSYWALNDLFECNIQIQSFCQYIPAWVLRQLDNQLIFYEVGCDFIVEDV